MTQGRGFFGGEFGEDCGSILWKTIASLCILEETEDIVLFAESLVLKGIKTYDALHIACAVAAHCEYYLTTDKKLLNTPVDGIKIVSPIVFVSETEE